MREKVENEKKIFFNKKKTEKKTCIWYRLQDSDLGHSFPTERSEVAMCTFWKYLHLPQQKGFFSTPLHPHPTLLETPIKLNTFLYPFCGLGGGVYRYFLKLHNWTNKQAVIHVSCISILIDHDNFTNLFFASSSLFFLTGEGVRLLLNRKELLGTSGTSSAATVLTGSGICSDLSLPELKIKISSVGLTFIHCNIVSNVM